jgi:hypothetical protein
VSNEWVVTVLHLDDRAEATQTVPTMPPEELPASNEAAQPELPKAMVFDASNTAQVAAPGSSTPAPSATNMPSQVAPRNLPPVNVSTETPK